MIQIKVPDAGDPYYNNIAGGGISTCITGSGGGIAGLNVLPNCVGGAVGCFNKAAAGDNKPTFKYLNYPPNAENLIEYAQKEGLTVSQTPAVGALVVWQKGATLNSSDGAGHTAFVNAVDEDGTIHTSESEWSGRAWVNSEYKPPCNYANGYKLRGFILQPSKPVPVHVIREGDHGAEVELMQARLHALGYMRRNEVDGDFGKITKYASNKIRFLIQEGSPTFARRSLMFMLGLLCQKLPSQKCLSEQIARGISLNHHPLQFRGWPRLHLIS